MKNLLPLFVSLFFLVGCSDSPSSSTSDTNAGIDSGSVADTTAQDTTDQDTNKADSSSKDTQDTDAKIEDTKVEDTKVEDAKEEDAPIEDVQTEDTQKPIVLPDEKPPIDKTFDMFIGDWTMSPGKEVTKCTLKRLDNVDPIFVTGLKTKLAKGSHHLIVYKSDETEEQAEPFDCIPFTEGLIGGTFPLIITQMTEEHLEFPNGIAMKLEPNQMIRIEAHFLNYFPEDIVAHADVSFETIKEADVVAEANMLFYGTPDFSVKANAVTQTPWNRLSQWENTNVFALTGHTHKLGTNVEVYKTSGEDDDGDEIYPLEETFNWAEAPVIQYDPPLSFKKGDGFRYRCTWDNPTNKNVTFGESANAEMCFFWAYYYPSQGYRLCVNAGQFGADFDIDQICCPGSPLCGLIDNFL